jgi:prophage regulatory protein
MHSDDTSQERILRLPQVKALCGLSRSSIYTLMKAGRFPKHINLGLRSVGWIESECQIWVTDQIKANRSQNPTSNKEA